MDLIVSSDSARALDHQHLDSRETLRQSAHELNRLRGEPGNRGSSVGKLQDSESGNVGKRPARHSEHRMSSRSVLELSKLFEANGGKRTT